MSHSSRWHRLTREQYRAAFMVVQPQSGPAVLLAESPRPDKAVDDA